MLKTRAGEIIGTGNLIRRPKVEAKTGLSRATIYRQVAAGTFPKPIPYSYNVNLWVEEEIDQWIANQIAERDRAAA